MQRELQALKSLPARDRLELIGELWDSLLDEPEGVPIPDWHLEELERRRQADGGKTEGVDWVTAMDRLRARYA